MSCSVVLGLLPTTSVRLFYSRGWPLPQRSAVLCCCPPSSYVSLLWERCFDVSDNRTVPAADD